jgi:uncharacterized protein YndB with AHSA1/START domain
MPSAQRTLTIAAPVSTVFAFFTDPDNDQKWRSHVKKIKADGPPAVGARIHQVVAGPGGRGILADLKITAYEPDQRYAFEVTTGPVRPRGDMRFTAMEGGTEVTFSLEADIGGLKKVLLSVPVQKSMDGELANLDKAKAMLESGS